MYGARDPLRGDEKCVQNCSRNFERERIPPKPMWRRVKVRGVKLVMPESRMSGAVSTQRQPVFGSVP